MSIVMKPTKLAQYSYEQYVAAGWTREQLIQHDLFVMMDQEGIQQLREQLAPVLARATESVWRDMRPAKTAEARPAAPNPFGVTDLSQVQAVYDEARHAARAAPGGYSFEAQLLEFATQLSRGTK